MLHNLTITLIKETRSRLASDWQDGVAPFKMPPEHIWIWLPVGCFTISVWFTLCDLFYSNWSL